MGGKPNPGTKRDRRLKQNKTTAKMKQPFGGKRAPLFTKRKH